MAGLSLSFVVLVFKLRLLSWDSASYLNPATADAQTLCVRLGQINKWSYGKYTFDFGKYYRIDNTSE